VAGGRVLSDQIKVMVVDDHSVFAEALALAIDATEALSCIGTARDVEQALGLADELRPDVAVMDVQLNGVDGVVGTRQLLERDPSLRVLVLTGLRLSPALIRDVADAGASAILPKSSSLGIVVDTIPLLNHHGVVVDRQSLVNLYASAGGSSVPRRIVDTPLLTRREQDILSLLTNGVDLQAASSRLGIKVNTTRGYVKNLYRKLGVHNQIELLAVARERGLLQE
jgi:DNA-binding NarL/FixJ family response regulator